MTFDDVEMIAAVNFFWLSVLAVLAYGAMSLLLAPSEATALSDRKVDEPRPHSRAAKANRLTDLYRDDSGAFFPFGAAKVAFVSLLFVAYHFLVTKPADEQLFQAVTSAISTETREQRAELDLLRQSVADVAAAAQPHDVFESFAELGTGGDWSSTTTIADSRSIAFAPPVGGYPERLLQLGGGRLTSAVVTSADGN